MKNIKLHGKLVATEEQIVKCYCRVICRLKGKPNDVAPFESGDYSTILYFLKTARLLPSAMYLVSSLLKSFVTFSASGHFRENPM